jgi:hypothetical protein
VTLYFQLEPTFSQANLRMAKQHWLSSQLPKTKEKRKTKNASQTADVDRGHVFEHITRKIHESIWENDPGQKKFRQEWRSREIYTT